MTTTPEQKNAILHDARNLVRMAIISQKPFLSTEDYEELESDCLMAASRAIDDYDQSAGAKLSSWIFRYAVQKRIKVLKHMKRRSLAVNYTECLSDCESLPIPCREHSAKHDAMIQDMEIIIDRARNDGVLTEREYRVLVDRRRNIIQPVIAESLGISFQRVSQIEAEAVRKIREKYRTAE